MPKKILVVDDELNVLKVIASRLKANNYDVVTASDGIYAVKKAIEEKPDLIILDIKMPAGGEGKFHSFEHSRWCWKYNGDCVWRRGEYKFW